MSAILDAFDKAAARWVDFMIESYKIEAANNEKYEKAFGVTLKVPLQINRKPTQQEINIVAGKVFALYNRLERWGGMTPAGDPFESAHASIPQGPCEVCGDAMAQYYQELTKNGPNYGYLCPTHYFLKLLQLRRLP